MVEPGSAHAFSVATTSVSRATSSNAPPPLSLTTADHPAAAASSRDGLGAPLVRVIVALVDGVSTKALATRALVKNPLVAGVLELA